MDWQDGPDLWPAILVGGFVGLIVFFPIVFVLVPVYVVGMLIYHAYFKD